MRLWGLPSPISCFVALSQLELLCIPLAHAVLITHHTPHLLSHVSAHLSSHLSAMFPCLFLRPQSRVHLYAHPVAVAVSFVGLSLLTSLILPFLPRFQQASGHHNGVPEFKKKSCFVFNSQHWFRGGIIKVVTSRTFDLILTIVIVMNCITLALASPFPECCKDEADYASRGRYSAHSGNMSMDVHIQSFTRARCSRANMPFAAPDDPPDAGFFDVGEALAASGGGMGGTGTLLLDSCCVGSHIEGRAFAQCADAVSNQVLAVFE